MKLAKRGLGGLPLIREKWAGKMEGVPRYLNRKHPIWCLSICYEIINLNFSCQSYSFFKTPYKPIPMNQPHLCFRDIFEFSYLNNISELFIWRFRMRFRSTIFGQQFWIEIFYVFVASFNAVVVAIFPETWTPDGKGMRTDLLTLQMLKIYIRIRDLDRRDQKFSKMVELLGPQNREIVKLQGVKLAQKGLFLKIFCAATDFEL